MKIAIPVKTNKKNPAISPLFGKAKWFAFVDTNNDKIDIAKNECYGGIEVMNWLAQKGVNIIIFQEMGATPYGFVKEMGDITLFHSGYDRLLLDEAIKKFKNNELTLIDDTNITTIITKHESKHTH
jgi:predicted Fe-Mo cluster-binding NifX family protein